MRETFWRYVVMFSLFASSWLLPNQAAVAQTRPAAVPAQANQTLWSQLGLLQGTATEDSPLRSREQIGDNLVFVQENGPLHTYQLSSGAHESAGFYRSCENRGYASELWAMSLTKVGNRLIFCANDRFYSTDGTITNTLILPITLVNDQGEPVSFSNFTTTGPQMFFADSGNNTWVSDGTISGTHRLDLPGNHTDLERFGEHYYAVADQQIWRTDTISATTVNLLPASAANQKILGIISTGSQLYISSCICPEPPSNPEIALWTSDGSAGSASLVRAFTGAEYSALELFGVWGERLLFNINTQRLWISDGSAEGTQELGPNTAFWKSTDDQQYFFFTSWDYQAPSNTDLYLSDGTPSGTRMVADNINYGGVQVSGNTAFFCAPVEGVTNFECSTYAKLLRINTTESEPTEIASGAFGSLLRAGAAIVSSYCKGTDCSLFWSDGTNEGTRFIKGPDFLSFADYNAFVRPLSIGDQVVFMARDYLHGAEPWISDGSVAGTRLLVDTNTRLRPLNIAGSTSTDTHLVVFTQQDLGLFTQSTQLWSTDGTELPTLRETLNGYTMGNQPHNLLSMGNKTVFIVADRQLSSTDDPTQNPPEYSVRVSDGINPSREIFRSALGSVAIYTFDNQLFLLESDVSNILPPDNAIPQNRIYRFDSDLTTATQIYTNTTQRLFKQTMHYFADTLWFAGYEAYRCRFYALNLSNGEARELGQLEQTFFCDYPVQQVGSRVLFRSYDKGLFSSDGSVDGGEVITVNGPITHIFGNGRIAYTVAEAKNTQSVLDQAIISVTDGTSAGSKTLTTIEYLKPWFTIAVPECATATDSHLDFYESRGIDWIGFNRNNLRRVDANSGEISTLVELPATNWMVPNNCTQIEGGKIFNLSPYLGTQSLWFTDESASVRSFNTMRLGELSEASKVATFGKGIYVLNPTEDGIALWTLSEGTEIEIPELAIGDARQVVIPVSFNAYQMSNPQPISVTLTLNLDGLEYVGGAPEQATVITSTDRVQVSFNLSAQPLQQLPFAFILRRPQGNDQQQFNPTLDSRIDQAPSFSQTLNVNIGQSLYLPLLNSYIVEGDFGR